MTKLRTMIRRRKNGKFQAVIHDQHGRQVWGCEHDHPYGTSNRVKQDSASKCGYAQVVKIREQEANRDSQEGNGQAQPIPIQA